MHNGDRLAAGEDPSSASVQEAKRWISIYSEMSRLEADLLATVRDRVGRMSTEARQATEETNIPALQKDMDNVTSRLAFWRARLALLSQS